MASFPRPRLQTLHPCYISRNHSSTSAPRLSNSCLSVLFVLRLPRLQLLARATSIFIALQRPRKTNPCSAVVRTSASRGRSMSATDDSFRTRGGSTRVVLLNAERSIRAVERRPRDLHHEGGRLNRHSGGRASGGALVLSERHLSRNWGGGEPEGSRREWDRCDRA